MLLLNNIFGFVFEVSLDDCRQFIVVYVGHLLRTIFVDIMLSMLYMCFVFGSHLSVRGVLCLVLDSYLLCLLRYRIFVFVFEGSFV